MKARGLFYCQHLLGIGHLARSLAICQALAEEFEIHLVQGGPKEGLSRIQPHFHHHFLPPLLMSEAESELYDPEGRRSVDEIWQDRLTHLQAITAQPFDFMVIELFPFGRNKFKHEVLKLIELVKARQPRARLYCSLRDILVEKKDQTVRERKIVELTRSIFDRVLVHADPQVIELSESFQSHQELADLTRYTGFVAERSSYSPSSRLKRILVSNGGGVVGGELLLTAASCAPHFPDFEILIPQGPHLPDSVRVGLWNLAQAHHNFRLTPMLLDFEKTMAESQLSLSLAGYNTVMNLLNTKTYGLVLPYAANREQSLRARKLADRGLLEVLEPNELTAERLSARIRLALEHKYPVVNINLEGARASARLIAQDLALEAQG